MSQRLKGQEVSLQIAVNGAPLTTLSDIRNFEFTPKFDKLEEGYLGMTTDLYDEIFKGVDFRLELHFETEDPLTILMQSILSRAQRRTPGTIVNLRATLAFPGGDRPRVSLQNCFFGNMPFNFPDRSQYASVTLEGSSSNIAVIG